MLYKQNAQFRNLAGQSARGRHGDEILSETTGIEGLCEGLAEHLYGCNMAAIRPEGSKDDGKPLKRSWFPIQEVELIESRNEEVQDVSDKTGPAKFR